MRPPLDHPTREWVQAHEAAMRKAAADAIAASNRWRQLNTELMAKWRAEGRDDLAIAQMKAANLTLSDAYGTYSFFAGKAQMHAAVLQGELAAQALLHGVHHDDPTGLRYDRGDDESEPVSPVPDYVDGLSITGRPPRRPAPNHPRGRAGGVESSPTGPSPSGHPHIVSGPVGAKQGAAAAGVAAAPTGGRSR
ncbi:hypothetical protein [Micromonospora globbae]|uniref:hypothetical protein n=1 Tax=Micromonospora globbae TaxID=1894969 RepID=UPI0034237B51